MSYFLIGMNHLNSLDKQFEERAILAADKGKIFLGLEGFTFQDRNILAQFMASAYGVKNVNNIYGIEDDFSNKFAGLLLHYGYFANAMQNQIYTAKVQFIYDLQTSPSIQQAFNKIATSGTPKQQTVNLIKAIKSFVNNNINLGLKSYVQKFSGLLNNNIFSNNAVWMDLFKDLIYEMINQGSNNYNLSSYVQNINCYIQNPQYKSNINFVVSNINGVWREGFIIKSMLKILNMAINLQLPIYFLIGSLHIASISQNLPSSYKNYNIKIFNNVGSVNKQYWP